LSTYTLHAFANGYDQPTRSSDAGRCGRDQQAYTIYVHNRGERHPNLSATVLIYHGEVEIQTGIPSKKLTLNLQPGCSHKTFAAIKLNMTFPGVRTAIPVYSEIVFYGTSRPNLSGARRSVRFHANSGGNLIVTALWISPAARNTWRRRPICRHDHLDHKQYRLCGSGLGEFSISIPIKTDQSARFSGRSP